MFYLTKSNYSKLLKALHINIPHNYIKSFYSNYKLPNFDLDLNFFTLPEAKKIVISHMLFNDIGNLEKILLIEKMSINRKNVYKSKTMGISNKYACIPYFSRM